MKCLWGSVEGSVSWSYPPLHGSATFHNTRHITSLVATWIAGSADKILLIQYMCLMGSLIISYPATGVEWGLITLILKAWLGHLYF